MLTLVIGTPERERILCPDQECGPVPARCDESAFRVASSEEDMQM